VDGDDIQDGEVTEAQDALLSCELQVEEDISIRGASDFQHGDGRQNSKATELQDILLCSSEVPDVQACKSTQTQDVNNSWGSSEQQHLKCRKALDDVCTVKDCEGTCRQDVAHKLDITESTDAPEDHKPSGPQDGVQECKATNILDVDHGQGSMKPQVASSHEALTAKKIVGYGEDIEPQDFVLSLTNTESRNVPDRCRASKPCEVVQNVSEYLVPKDLLRSHIATELHNSAAGCRVPEKTNAPHSCGSAEQWNLIHSCKCTDHTAVAHVLTTPEPVDMPRCEVRVPNHASSTCEAAEVETIVHSCGLLEDKQDMHSCEGPSRQSAAHGCVATKLGDVRYSSCPSSKPSDNASPTHTHQSLDDCGLGCMRVPTVTSPKEDLLGNSRAVGDADKHVDALCINLAGVTNATGKADHLDAPCVSYSCIRPLDHARSTVETQDDLEATSTDSPGTAPTHH
jgi:hypothetical protein